MSKFYTEGVVKEISVKEKTAHEGDVVSFVLEPVSPYIFEKKKDNGGTEKYLIFVDNVDNPNESRIKKSRLDFTMPNPCDVNSLLIAKANRMRVGITVASEDFKVTKVKFN